MISIRAYHELPATMTPVVLTEVIRIGHDDTQEHQRKHKDCAQLKLKTLY